MNNGKLASYNSQQIVSKRSISLPNKLTGEISPWSFYKQHGENRMVLVIPPIQPPALSPPPQLISPPKHPTPSPRRNLSQLSDQPIFLTPQKPKYKSLAPKILELVNDSYVQRQSKSFLPEVRPNFGDRLVLPDIDKKFFNRLLPENYDRDDQISIQAIFDGPEIRAQRDIIRRRVMKGRRKSNVKVMYDKYEKDGRMWGEVEDFEVEGRRKQIQFKK